MFLIMCFNILCLDTKTVHAYDKYFNEGIVLYKDKRYKDAYWLFDKSAQNKNYMAYFIIGSMYYDGLGIEISYKDALKYFEKSVLYGNKDRRCYFIIGDMYYRGIGTKKNVKKAVEYLSKSANLGDNKSILYLASIADKDKDYSKSRYYLEQAAKNNEDVVYCRLGVMNLKGQGGDKNYDVAKKLFEESIKAGHNCYAELGAIYYGGYGVSKDYVKAREYFEKSFKNGNNKVAFNLAMMYGDGIGGKKDINKAKELFENAASHGVIHSYLMLGNMYYYGVGTKINYKKAKDLFEKSVANGNHYALKQLGKMYILGHGVLSDRNKWIDLIKQGCSKGDKIACNEYKEISSNNPIDTSKNFFEDLKELKDSLDMIRK